MSARKCLILLCLAGLVACTQFPDLDGRLTPEVEAADYPELVALSPLLAGRTLPQERGEELQQSIEARVAALRARSQRLRRRVLNSADRARLAEQPGA
jgi:hypothetical protein